MTFHYTALDCKGDKDHGTVEARCESDAILNLRGLGLYSIMISDKPEEVYKERNPHKMGSMKEFINVLFKACLTGMKAAGYALLVLLIVGVILVLLSGLICMAFDGLGAVAGILITVLILVFVIAVLYKLDDHYGWGMFC